MSASAYGRCPFIGGCRYRVFLRKWPGPQTGVRLREVYASGGSTVWQNYIQLPDVFTTHITIFYYFMVVLLASISPHSTSRHIWIAEVFFLQVCKTAITHYFSTKKAQEHLNYTPTQHSMDNIVKYFKDRGHGRKRKPPSRMGYYLLNVIMGLMFVCLIFEFLPLVKTSWNWEMWTTCHTAVWDLKDSDLSRQSQGTEEFNQLLSLVRCKLTGLYSNLQRSLL